MGKIIRRGEVVPVQPRRVAEPLPPSTAYVPGDVPPPPAAGGTQNIVYVVAPQAAAAPPPPPPPVEVHHHHHHTTTVVLPPVRRRRSKGTSFLGTLAFVVGGLACGMAFVPQVAWAGVYVAMAGVTAGALSWVGAVLFRRVGATMPFVGLVVAAGGYLLGLYNTGQAQGTYDKLRSRLPLPAVTFPVPKAGAADPTPAGQSPAVAKPPAAAHRFGEGTIFDMGPGEAVKPTTRP